MITQKEMITRNNWQYLDKIRTKHHEAGFCCFAEESTTLCGNIKNSRKTQRQFCGKVVKWFYRNAREGIIRMSANKETIAQWIREKKTALGIEFGSTRIKKLF